MQIADRMASIPFSGIRHVFEEVMRRERAGETIIHLNIGRPDFDTPSNIKEAAKKALDDGQVHYSSNYGIAELRDALAEQMTREQRCMLHHHVLSDQGSPELCLQEIRREEPTKTPELGGDVLCLRLIESHRNQA